MKSLLFCTVLLVIVTDISAQKITIATNPIAAGFSPERLNKFRALTYQAIKD